MNKNGKQQMNHLANSDIENRHKQFMRDLKAEMDYFKSKRFYLECKKTNQEIALITMRIYQRTKDLKFRTHAILFLNNAKYWENRADKIKTLID